MLYSIIIILRYRRYVHKSCDVIPPPPHTQMNFPLVSCSNTLMSMTHVWPIPGQAHCLFPPIPGRWGRGRGGGVGFGKVPLQTVWGCEPLSLPYWAENLAVEPKIGSRKVNVIVKIKSSQNVMEVTDCGIWIVAVNFENLHLCKFFLFFMPIFWNQQKNPKWFL